MNDPRPGNPPAVLPPTHLAQFISKDVDEVRFLLNRFFYPIAVGMPHGASGFALGLDVIALGPLTVGRFSFGAATTLTAPELDAYHVTMPSAGRCITRHAGREVSADRATAAVFGPGRPVYTLHDAHSDELDIKIGRTALEEELSVMLDHSIQGPLDLPPAIDVSTGLGFKWRRIIEALHTESSHADGLIHEPLIGHRLRRLVMGGLLLAMPHRYQSELLAPARQTAPRSVRRVQDAIESEPERAFAVTDLALIAGVSVRSLQDSFRRYLGRTPMAYLQEVRLERAHRNLRDADPSHETVSTIAHRWGFAHLGRFALAYRSRYQESPSETLRKNL